MKGIGEGVLVGLSWKRRGGGGYIEKIFVNEVDHAISFREVLESSTTP